jgi:hypothetical protein
MDTIHFLKVSCLLIAIHEKGRSCRIAYTCHLHIRGGRLRSMVYFYEVMGRDVTACFRLEWCDGLAMSEKMSWGS